MFSDSEIENLRAPHVARAVFVDLDLPTGQWKLHNGVGTVNVGGQEWQGLSDPSVGRLVSIEGLEVPRFGAAPKLDIVLTGITVEFLQSLRSFGNDIEGRACVVYWCAFNAESQTPLMDLKKLFDGKLSAPKLVRQGISQRILTVAVESPYHSLNFQFGGRWSNSDHKRKYPNDKGLEYIGIKQQEVIK